MYTSPLPIRKKNRLPKYDYASVGAYFVTICISDRHPILWENTDHLISNSGEIILNAIGKTIQQGINQLSEHYPHIHVDKYCIMPDHIHMLLVFMPDINGRQIAAPTLSTVIGHFKRWVSVQLGFSIWQKSFYDRVIRNDSGYRDVWKYIDENPLKMQIREHHAGL